MIRNRYVFAISLFMTLTAAASYAQENRVQIDFSKNTAEENGVTLMGAGFGAYPMPEVTFGSVPTNNVFEGATDGRGVIIQAGPGEGVMILGKANASPHAAFLRCSVRANASHVSVYLATIGQDDYQFISTTTPANGIFFLNQYKRLSGFFVPPSSGFQPLIQVLNTSAEEPVMVYLDNFEYYSLISGMYYSADFIDGDNSDPDEIAITPSYPTPTDTPAPPTPTPTVGSNGFIEFYGAVSDYNTHQPIADVRLNLSGSSIKKQTVLTQPDGSFTISVYGYLFDVYSLAAEIPGYATVEIQSDHDSASNPWKRQIDILLQPLTVPVNTPTPTYTLTPTPSYTPTIMPTLTPTPTPIDYGAILFYGAVTNYDTGERIAHANIVISGDSIVDQTTLSADDGTYNITIYGYLFDFYALRVEADGYYATQTLSNYNPNEPAYQLNNIVLKPIPLPTPTQTPIPPASITVDLGALPAGAKPLEMIWCAPGTFTMGSPETEEGRKDDEIQHKVTLTRGFYIGKYELTQAQWQAITGKNPSNFTGINLPVEKVSWVEVNDFITALNARKIGAFRLPTEAEWEYACRAGTATRYYWDEDPQYNMIPEYAWYDSNSTMSTHEVGEKIPNAWGLYDMLGNVFEWCSDYYAPYSANPQIDPAGPTSGTERVRRGGSWLTNSFSCRSAIRGQLIHYQRSQYLGFRLVRDR